MAKLKGTWHLVHSNYSVSQNPSLWHLTPRSHWSYLHGHTWVKTLASGSRSRGRQEILPLRGPNLQMLRCEISVPGLTQTQRPVDNSLSEQLAWAASWPAQHSTCLGSGREASPLLGQLAGVFLRPREVPFFLGIELVPASTWGLLEG